jgi:hypothetical protein
MTSQNNDNSPFKETTDPETGRLVDVESDVYTNDEAQTDEETNYSHLDYPFPLCKSPETLYAFMHSFLTNVQVHRVSPSVPSKYEKHTYQAEWKSQVLNKTYAARGIHTDPLQARLQAVNNLLQGTFFFRPMDSRLRNHVIPGMLSDSKNIQGLQNLFDVATERIKRGENNDERTSE